MSNVYHRGRMIDHVQLVVKDTEKSKVFYKAVLGTLGVPLADEGKGYFVADELFVCSEGYEAGVAPTGRVHLAFQAPNKEAVQRFHQAALESGGKDNGAPGQRNYHPGYYAAFVLDPDGNNIEAVFHGPIKRSAGSVELSPG